MVWLLSGGGSWIGSSKASEVDANGVSPAFPTSVLPETDEVRPAAEHFSIALSSLKVVRSKVSNIAKFNRVPSIYVLLTVHFLCFLYSSQDNQLPRLYYYYYGSSGSQFLTIFKAYFLLMLIRSTRSVPRAFCIRTDTND